MARARNIKPGFFKNEVLGVADPLYSLLFEGLWILADRAGKLEDRPLRIKGELFPYRDGVDVDAMLGWLQDSGFIRRYRVAGKGYILILAFVKHQSPHKNENPSDIPDPEEIGSGSEKIGKDTDESGSARADSLIPDSLNLNPDSSEPKGSGGAPPEPKQHDPVKHEIWTTGRAVLRVTGEGDKELGKFLGKLIGDYTPGIVLDAVRATAAALPDDPKEYLKACCERASGKRKNPRAAPSKHAAAAAGIFGSSQSPQEVIDV